MPPHDLNLCIMVIIKVYLNWDAVAGDHRVFERQLSWDPSVRFPIDGVVSVMKLLFGANSVVQILFG